MLAYRAVRTLLRSALGVFFRQIHVVGLENVPAEASVPVVFAGNHPNSLIDPVLIITTSGRFVHFAAKDKLFKWPLKAMLLALGCVPIMRRMDHGDGGARDNSAAFDALFAVLARGRAMGIFPEGLSHDAANLARLRTGAARIALDMATKHPDAGLVIVPTGLTYVHRKRFRSRVLVQYGEPIVVDEAWVAQWRQDTFAAAGALTDRIGEGIRALTVNAPDWETLRVLDGVRRMYQPPGISLRDRVELARRFASVYPTVADEPDVRDAYRAVEAYLDRLDASGLTDRDLVRGLEGGRLVRRTIGNLAVLFFWFPLAIPGALIHAPFGLLVGWAGLRFAPRKDVIGTSRLLVGLLGVLGLYTALPVITVAVAGWAWGLIVAFALPISGFATLRILERGASLRRIVRTAIASFTLRHELRELRETRGALQERIIDAVDRFRPADMELLFPRTPEVP